MEHQEIDTLRERHAAWRLLRAGNPSLVLGFLGRHFVEENHGATSASVLAAALDDELYALNTDAERPRYPKSPTEYLGDWPADTAAWLRRLYPLGSDEIHYDELALYTDLVEGRYAEKRRLEQERIDWAWVADRLS